MRSKAWRRKRAWLFLVIRQKAVFAARKVIGYDSVSSVLFPTSATFVDGSGASKTIGGISAATFVGARRVLLLADRSHVYSADLQIDNGVLAHVRFLTDTPLLASHQLDSEGLAVSGRTAFVSTETPPEIFSCVLNDNRTGTIGRCRRAFDTETFASAPHNAGFEALCITPSGEQLVTATEGPLPVDTSGILRLTSFAVSNTSLPRQLVYNIDSNASYTGKLVELLSLDNESLHGGHFLALERSYQPSIGNEIRLYLVDTSNATDVFDCGALRPGRCTTTGQDLIPVSKDLILTWKGQDPLRLTADNYEGMALVPGGSWEAGWWLLLVNDDNFNPQQIGTQFVMLRLLTARPRNHTESSAVAARENDSFGENQFLPFQGLANANVDARNSTSSTSENSTSVTTGIVLLVFTSCLLVACVATICSLCRRVSCNRQARRYQAMDGLASQLPPPPIPERGERV